MKDQLGKRIAILFQSVISGADKPGRVFSVIDTVWALGEITAKEKDALIKKAEAIKKIDEQIRGFVSRREGKGDPISDRDLKRVARQWYADPDELFNEMDRRLLKARIKRDLKVEF